MAEKLTPKKIDQKIDKIQKKIGALNKLKDGLKKEGSMEHQISRLERGSRKKTVKHHRKHHKKPVVKRHKKKKFSLFG
jgi:hypothetical protein